MSAVLPLFSALRLFFNSENLHHYVYCIPLRVFMILQLALYCYPVPIFPVKLTAYRWIRIVLGIYLLKKSHGSLTYDAGEIFWKMEVRISSVAIVLCLSEIVGNSFPNKSIKDTDTYLYDRYCITINRPCYAYF